MPSPKRNNAGIAEQEIPMPDPGRLQAFLDGRWAGARAGARAQLQDPLFAPVYGLDTEAHRDRVAEQMRALAETPGPLLGFPERYGGGGDIGGFVTSFETLAFGDFLFS